MNSSSYSAPLIESSQFIYVPSVYFRCCAETYFALVLCTNDILFFGLDNKQFVIDSLRVVHHSSERCSIAYLHCNPVSSDFLLI